MKNQLIRVLDSIISEYDYCIFVFEDLEKYNTLSGYVNVYDLAWEIVVNKLNRIQYDQNQKFVTDLESVLMDNWDLFAKSDLTLEPYGKPLPSYLSIKRTIKLDDFSSIDFNQVDFGKIGGVILRDYMIDIRNNTYAPGFARVFLKEFMMAVKKLRDDLSEMA